MTKKKISRQKGFTLIELIASIAVFTIVTGVILYNYAQFNTNVLITNYAYDVALTIRQAQVYGVAVRERVAGQGDFNASYGVHFENASPNSFVFFADSNNGTGNRANIYDSGLNNSGVSDESLGTSYLPGAYVFKNFCVIQNSAPQDRSSGVVCTGGDLGGGALSSLDISFTRPEPDAHIRVNGIQTTVESYREATVCIKSPLGKVRQVIVESTGQIWVSDNGLSNTSCDQPDSAPPAP